MNKFPIAAPLLTILLAACQPEATLGTIGRTSENLGSGNHLALNHLALNHLALNHLALNHLALNQLELDQLPIEQPGPGQYVFAGNGMEATPEGRDVLAYLSSCALPAGTQLLVQHDGVEYAFAGHFGTAPEWLSQALAGPARRWLTACLLAHVNAYGVSVQISVRAPDGMATADAAEQESFPVYEATFFGDFFADDPKIYACQGSRYDVASAHSPDRALRVCSDDTPDCAIQAVGPCYRVCDTQINKYGATGCTADGVVYEQTFSVWLRDPDTAGVNDSCTAGADCQLSCVGSACDDAVLDCADSQSCQSVCAPGRICTTDCAGSGRCRARCRGATCDVDCTDTDACQARCVGGGDCEFDCRGSADCDGTVCRDGSECLLVCDPGDPSCGFALCQGGSGITDCGGGVVVCNRPCPQ